VKDLAADTNGATAIEYALIASLISIVIVTGATAIGTKLSTFFVAINFTTP
jgi:pilus assembly protein Flp/PilA